jgi:Tfp pilus assembly protein FimT
MELLLVIAIAGIIMAMGYPRLSSTVRRQGLRNARVTAATMYATARSAAIQSNRVTRLRVVGNSMVVLRNPANGGAVLDTIVPALDFAARYGVTVSGTTDSVVVDPRGFATDAKLVLTHSAGQKDSIVVSRYGRILQWQ